MARSALVPAAEVPKAPTVDSGKDDKPTAISPVRLDAESGDDLFIELDLCRGSDFVFREDETAPDGEFQELEALFPDRDIEPIEGLTAEQFELEGKLHPERYQFLVRWLAAATRSGRVDRVIDAGAGPAFLTSLVSARWPEARVIAVDRSSDMVQLASERLASTPIEVVQADIRQIDEIRRGDLDAIVSRRMIHRVDDLHAVLHRMVSALKPGGVLVNYSFRQPSTPLSRAAFERAAAIRKPHRDLYAAYVRAVLNAPRIEDYRLALIEVATKLQVNSVRLKVHPFDVGFIVER